MKRLIALPIVALVALSACSTSEEVAEVTSAPTEAPEAVEEAPEPSAAPTLGPPAPTEAPEAPRGDVIVTPEADLDQAIAEFVAVCQDIEAGFNDGSLILSDYQFYNFDGWCAGLYGITVTFNETPQAEFDAICSEFINSPDSAIYDLAISEGFDHDGAVGWIDGLWIFCLDQ